MRLGAPRRSLVRRARPCSRLAPLAHAAPLPLTTRLARRSQCPAVAADASGAIAVDLATGQTLFERNPDDSLAPASNEKLTVTLAALQELGTRIPLPHRSARARIPGRCRLARRPLPEGLRRPDAHVARARATRRAADALRASAASTDACSATSRGSTRCAPHPAGSRRYFINECPPLSALVVDRGVYENHVALQPALAAAGRLRQIAARARDHDRPGGRRPGTAERIRARTDRVGAAARRVGGDGPRQRQLHRRGAAEDDRRRGRRRRHDRGGRGDRARATSRPPASRSRACGSSTARASRSPTG